MWRRAAEVVGWCTMAAAAVHILVEGAGLIPMMIECTGRCAWGE